MTQHTLRHRMAGYPLHPATEILILGTFNPDTPGNTADFFYGRSRNYLWRLLPTAFGAPDLKGKSKEEKITFLHQYHIGFADLIAAVQVATGNETNYLDDYIDSRVVEWTDVVALLKKLKRLKKVLFTRKTFTGVPRIKARLEPIKAYCRTHDIYYQELITPARGYTPAKQEAWTKALNH